MTQHILVTGGTGYIGSHTVVQLLEAGMGYEERLAQGFSESAGSFSGAVEYTLPDR